MLDLFTEHHTEELIDYIKDNYNPDLPLLVWLDLFCGCGGITEGFEDAHQNNFVVACVNHDEYAIKSHHKNHPKCIHYTEDIRDWYVIYKVQSLFTRLREVFPNLLVGLHASLECIHFSRAKGGMPRDGDSRTLGNHLIKYLSIRPDYITIENVDEFTTWGPMEQLRKGRLWKASNINEKKKVLWLKESYEDNPSYYDENDFTPWEMPIKSRKGEDYNKWVKSFQEVGYNYESRSLNAADFEAYTSRQRYFGIFALDGFPIEFPKPTAVSRKKQHLFPDLKPHKAVKDVLNLDVEGRSIFGLTKQGKKYVKASKARVYHGLIKSWRDGYFMVRYNGGDPKNKNQSIDKPLGTILTTNTHSLCEPIFLTSYYGASKDGNGVHSLDEPCNTLTTKDRFTLHHLQYAYGEARTKDVEKGDNQFIQYDYSNKGKGNHSNLNEPAGTVTSVPKHRLITAKWLFDTQFDRKGMSIEKPSPTIIASQHKKPLYLASASNKSEIDQSLWNEEDDFTTMLLRTFMRQHGITDVKIRSLEIDELLKIQGFPEDYILEGGKVRSLKYIGNSVCPPMSKAFGASIYNSLLTYKEQ